MADPDHEAAIAEIKRNQANAGKPGFNAYGVPLDFCFGRKPDAHYWAWIANRNQQQRTESNG